MDKLFILQLTDIPVGGWITAINHEYRGLKLLGFEPTVIRIGSSKKTLPHQNGTPCLRLPKEEIVKLQGRLVLASVYESYKSFAVDLIKRGAYIVAHDPVEYRDQEYTRVVKNSGRVIVHRRSMLKHFPGAYVLPHVYVRAGEGVIRPEWKSRSKQAISLSRLGLHKNTEWSIEANRSLDPDIQIELFGHEWRPYTMKLQEVFPEFKQDKGSPKYDCSDPDFAVKKAKDYRFLVDLSTYPGGDGGGTQYTFLEGLDAGCVCVLNRGWYVGNNHKSLFGDEVIDGVNEMEPDKNCVMIKSPLELASFIKDHRKEKDTKSFIAKVEGIQQEAEVLLKRHAPEAVVPNFLKYLKIRT